MKANSVGEFFGTLQQSVIESWRSHLKTDKYSSHMTLDEFYKEMPELVDALIEDYQGIYGKIKEYKNILQDDLSTIQYLESLREMVDDGRKILFKESELQSDIDSILSQIDSTLYKLKELKEHKMSLSNFLVESLPPYEKKI